MIGQFTVLYGRSVCCMNCSFREGNLIRSTVGFHLRRSGRLRELNVGDTGLQSSDHITNMGRSRGVSADSGGAIRGRSGAARIGVEM